MVHEFRGKVLTLPPESPKEGTLSEKTAFKEFGLTEDDIITAINAPPQIMMLGWGLISKDMIMQD